MSTNNSPPGVYVLQKSGDLELVHGYTDEDYQLSDISGMFALGTLDAGGEGSQPMLKLTRRELRSLKVQADAESFDHPEGFIEMCLEIYRYADSTDDEVMDFISIE